MILNEEYLNWRKLCENHNYKLLNINPWYKKKEFILYCSKCGRIRYLSGEIGVFGERIEPLFNDIKTEK